jgi:hypothetical protein
LINFMISEARSGCDHVIPPRTDFAELSRAFRAVSAIDINYWGGGGINKKIDI